MRHLAKPYYLLAILLVFLASCSKKSNVPVPADAALVLHINGNSLHSKFSWEEFKQSELYKLASEEAKDDLAQKILSNPDSSGIDITSDAFLFVRMRGRSAYTGFTCAIKDEKAFAALVQKASGGESPVKTGDISVIKSYNAVFTWSKKRFVMISNSPEFNSPMTRRMNDFDRRDYFTEDSLVKFASEVYTIKGSASIGSNDKFADMMKESGDMHFWANPGKFYQGAMGAMLSLTKASILFEGNYATATLNFDKGKIVIDGKSYANKELAALNKKYKPENLSEDMLKKIPAGNVNAAIAGKYSPEKFKELLVLLGLDGLANNYLGEVGYSLDELVQASNGDLLVSVSDFEVAEKETKYTIDGKEYSFKNKKPDAKLLFATSVKNKASFEKLLTGLKEKFGGENGDFRKIIPGFPYLLRDNWFLAGDSGLIHTYGSASTNHAFISKISGHPMGGYVDIQKFIMGSRNSADSSAILFFDESVKFWQDVVFYGGEYKNGATESHFEVNLVDKNTNSLKQMVSYLGTMLRSLKNETEKRRQADFGEWQNENLPPVVDTVIAKP